MGWMAQDFNSLCQVVTRYTLPDHENTLTKEWLVTNGLGGYASSSVIGTNTRRYHGLLVAAFNPPTGRKVMVSKVEETILYNDKETRLSTNQYPDAIYPEGYHHIKHFTRNPIPTTVFKAGETELLKSVFMVYNSNTTVVEYKNISNTSYKLRLTPLYAIRGYHRLLREEHDYKYFVQHKNLHHSIYAYAGAEPLYLKHSSGTFTEQRYWNKNIYYALEKRRGQEFIEDLYCLGFIECDLIPGESLFLTFSLDEEILTIDPEELKKEELIRLVDLVPKNSDNDFLADLFVSGDQFIVHRKSTDNYSIIAGYHWFTDWGRDSMIVIRGLCIAAGKQKEAASVILTFLNLMKEGIIPNRFTDYETDLPEYHTIDATLWMFIAIFEYDQKFNDRDFLESIYDRLAKILDYHLKGTMHNIHVTPEGFLCGGTGALPLTWMDARVNNHIFTPRQGCPVEVNALWYNALRVFEYITIRVNKRINHSYKAISYKIENNFEEIFWNEKGYLNDVINEDGTKDESVRPNQIYAVSLPFSLLSKEKERLIVDNVKNNLLTHYGLRTLCMEDLKFKPTYSGDVWSRDAAYHQGTVWPFLLPEYHLAYLKVNDYSPKSKKEVETQLKYLKAHFYNDECLNAISEVFDGASPRSGKGCVQQAWSVSNLILLILKAGLEV